MKNVRKLFTLIFVAILACTFSFTTVLAADAPSSITVKRAEVLRDLITNHEYGYTVFETTDGKTIYCLDNLKEALKTGQNASLVGNADDGVLYILQKGYPNVQKVDGMTWTNVAARDFYITQAAVWLYMEETGQGSNKLSDEFKNATTTDVYKLLPRIKTLVANAKKYKDNQVKPNMVLKTNGDNLTLSKDKKYYESPLMTATLTGASTYSVTVNGGTNGTKVVNEKGETKNNFNSNEKVKVIVPVSEIKETTDISLEFTASGKIEKAKIYKTNDNNYQRVAGLYDEVVSLKQTTKVTVTPKPHVCEIDGDKYYGINGTLVDKDTYDAECNNHVCEIVGDDYYGINGNIVDQKTFDKECGSEVIVPNTSANVSPLAIVIGLLMVVSGSGLIAYKTKKSYL